MSMQTWAEKEIEIACKHERAGNETPEGEWDYGCACYESALKAFKSLMSDGHSGFSWNDISDMSGLHGEEVNYQCKRMSSLFKYIYSDGTVKYRDVNSFYCIDINNHSTYIGITKYILNRLIDGKPLTPIEDTPDVWNDISDMSGLHGEEVNYQCKRMSSLFKYIYSDGTVKYRDVNSFYCIDINNHSTYHSGLVQRIIDEMLPISMPYMPTEPIKVYCEGFLTDRKNGDFDAVGVFYAIKPDGERIEINRFFKEATDGWDEIDDIEYNHRKTLQIVK